MTPQAPLTGSGCREHSYGGFGGGHPHFHPHAVFRKLQLIGFKRVRDSLSSSVATWAFSGNTHHDIQDHPVYIPRDLGPGQG